MYKRAQGKATSWHNKTYYITVFIDFYIDLREQIITSDTDVYYLAKVNVVSSNLIARSNFLHFVLKRPALSDTCPVV